MIIRGDALLSDTILDGQHADAFYVFAIAVLVFCPKASILGRMPGNTALRQVLPFCLAGLRNRACRGLILSTTLVIWGRRNLEAALFIPPTTRCTNLVRWGLCQLSYYPCTVDGGFSLCLSSNSPSSVGFPTQDGARIAS